MKTALRLMACAWIAAASARAAGPPAEAGQVRVESDPPGAAVTVDGRAYDVTPALVSGLLPGKRLLIVNKEGYQPVRRTLDLAAGRREVVQVRLAPVLGLVLVTTDPPGAEIQVDGAARGTSPLVLHDLPLGAYRLRASAPGCQPKEVNLTLADRRPVKLDIPLASGSGTLTVQSTPTGARVLLNGVAGGVTPCTLSRAPAGENTLELSLEGYAPYRHVIKLQAGQRETLEIVLKPVPARLRVVSVPPGARIYVGDQFRGMAPVALDDVEPGSCVVRAELKGYETATREVEVERNADLVEEFRLELNSGALELTTEPAGARVFVDGEQAGVTAAATNATDQVSQPLTVAALSLGEHTVQVTRMGYFEDTFTIQVDSTSTVSMHRKLKRRFIPDTELMTAAGRVEGVLVEKGPAGDIRIEVAPGVFKTIPAADIRSTRPLRTDNPR